MGWTFPYHTHEKRDIIEEIVEDQSSNERIWKALRHCVRGNVLWVLVESGPVDGKKRKYIACYLLGKGGGDTWGYKDMDESMHPYFYTCPISYLDETDEPTNDSAREWRAEVRRIASELASKKPKINEIWKLKRGCFPPHVKITSIRPLQGIASGRAYRISKKHLSRRIEEGEGS